MIMWQGHSCLSIIRHLYTYRKPFSSQHVDFVLRFKRHMSPYRVLTCLKGRDYRCDRRNPSKFHCLPVVLPSLQWSSSLLIWPFKGHKWWNTSHTSGGDGNSAWTDWRWRPGRRPHLPIFPRPFPRPLRRRPRPIRSPSVTWRAWATQWAVVVDVLRAFRLLDALSSNSQVI